MRFRSDPLGPEDESRHHHKPTHLPAGADLDREGMDGVGVLGLSERPNARVAAPGAGSAGNNACRYGPVAGQDPLPLRGIGQQPAVEASARLR
ncbi:hypothetical protein G6F23_013796 [Rhizopus arrhizus]|nr:hypothetical protein G6F23_013796 [Rhizopus arrhizus]